MKPNQFATTLPASTPLITDRRRKRRGNATLDYVLLMGVVLPMIAFVYWIGPRIMNLVFQLTNALLTWPFS
ncbi:MAG: hypothetical protein ACKOBW_02740 [Planctomycetota bacterium]